MKKNKIAKSFLAIVIILLSAFSTVYGQTIDSIKMTNVSIESNLDRSDTLKTEVHWCKNEFSISGGIGGSILNYRPDVGVRKNRLGGSFGLNYLHNFTSNWGILIGIEAATYQSSLYINNLTDNYNAVDKDPYNYDNPEEYKNFNFRYRIYNYEEKQNLVNINIPVALQFQAPIKTIHKYYLSLGFKLGIPVYARYENRAERIESYGFYPEWNQVLNEPNSLGFGNFGYHSSEGALDIDLAYIGTIETGVKWRVGNAVYLYTGLYFDYGFNDVMKTGHNERFVDYDSYPFDYNGSFTINDALNAQYTTNDNSVDIGFGEYSEHNTGMKPIVSKVSPLSLGLKLRLSFGCPEKKEIAEIKKANKYCEQANNNDLFIRIDSLTEALKNKKHVVDTIVLQEEKHVVDTIFIVQQDKQLQEPLNTKQQELAELRKGYIEDAGIINFDLNIWKLDYSQQLIMNKYVRMMLMHPEYTLLITGHTCDLGSNESNLQLGLKRANFAKEYMISQGINANRIITFTGGEEDPIVPNNSDKNRKQNRRLEFGIIQK